MDQKYLPTANIEVEAAEAVVMVTLVCHVTSLRHKKDQHQRQWHRFVSVCIRRHLYNLTHWALMLLFWGTLKN